MIMAFYISRYHIKAVDKIAMGFEPQEDSLFMIMLRVPSYGLAFIWPFYAKRAGLLETRNSLDKKTKRPFILNLLFLTVSVVSLTIAVLIGKYVLHVM